MEFKLEVGVDNNPIQYNNTMDYKLGYELAENTQPTILILLF